MSPIIGKGSSGAIDPSVRMLIRPDPVSAVSRRSASGSGAAASTAEPSAVMVSARTTAVSTDVSFFLCVFILIHPFLDEDIEKTFGGFFDA
jgi:hypothetical protein